MPSTGNVVWPLTGSTSAHLGGGLTNPTNANDTGTSNFATHTFSGTSIEVSQNYDNFGLDTLLPVGCLITGLKVGFQSKKTGSGTEVLTGKIYVDVSNALVATCQLTETSTLTLKECDIFGSRPWTRSDLLDGTFRLIISGVTGSSGLGSVTLNANDLYVNVSYSTGRHRPPGLNFQNPAIF